MDSNDENTMSLRSSFISLCCERRAATVAGPLRMQGFALPVSSPGRSLFQRLYPLSSRRFPSQFSPSNRPASVGFFTALRLAAPPLHS
ncbi:hypothetical protein, partial [Yersinia pestis]|uniref:hypothetical protein n=5 Tax=Yersinia pestis TaxID=632 RepID=UPI001ED99024